MTDNDQYFDDQTRRELDALAEMAAAPGGPGVPGGADLNPGEQRLALDIRSRIESAGLLPEPDGGPRATALPAASSGPDEVMRRLIEALEDNTRAVNELQETLAASGGGGDDAIDV